MPVILALCKAEVSRLLRAQEFEISLGNIAKPCLYQKKHTKLASCGNMPATQEAEAGESLEPGRLRLQ